MLADVNGQDCYIRFQAGYSVSMTESGDCIKNKLADQVEFIPGVDFLSCIWTLAASHIPGTYSFVTVLALLSC